jgi:hypothetical protein
MTFLQLFGDMYNSLPWGVRCGVTFWLFCVLGNLVLLWPKADSDKPWDKGPWG